MSISVSDLDQMLAKLNGLADVLRADPRPQQSPLDKSDPLAVQADACEFPLPSPLTIATLKETVDRKIENVGVLLQRARMHEQLPPDAQEAAEQENDLIEENYQTHESVYGLPRQ